MNKSSRRLIKAVAILLTLVLFTTSIVSNTMAKFIVEKSATAPIRLKNMGVTIELDVLQSIKDACEEVEVTQNGNSLSVELKGLKMAPGDDFSETINFALSGAATTYLRMNMDVDVIYDLDDFYIDPSVDPSDIDGCSSFMPIVLNAVVNTSESSLYVFYPNWIDNGYYSMEDYIFYKETFSAELYWTTAITGVYNTSGDLSKPTDLSFERVLGVGDQAGFLNYDNELVNTFNFGFSWPYYENSQWDARDTWLMNNDPSFSIVYTFTLEQVDYDYPIPDIEYV